MTSATTTRAPRDLQRARRTVLVAVVVAVVIVAVGYPYLGAIAIAICVLFAVSFLPWRLTSYGRPADPLPLVVPYLVAVIFFKVHVGEEYLSEIWEGFSRIGQPMTEQTFFLVAAVIAPIFWLIGLMLLYLRTEIGNWMAWVFVIAMAIVESSHFLYPFMDTGHFGYFPGIYTCLLVVAAGWFLGIRLYRAGRPEGAPQSKRAVLWLLKHTLNPVAIRSARAGRGFDLVRHVGRKTGRVYETPLILACVDGGFVAELTYGTDVAWYRNVVAAGRCAVLVRGSEYEIDRIEPYPCDAGRSAFGFPGSVILTLLLRRDFRFLREAATDREAVAESN